MLTDRRCSNCKNHWLEDNGYSNYTIMGTAVHCSKGLHPEGEFDLWYRRSTVDGYAAICAEWMRGDPILHMDVDTECEPSLTPHQREVYESPVVLNRVDEWEAWPSLKEGLKHWHDVRGAIESFASEVRRSVRATW